MALQDTFGSVREAQTSYDVPALSRTILRRPFALPLE
jgi:hypothetical protein